MSEKSPTFLRSLALVATLVGATQAAPTVKTVELKGHHEARDLDYEVSYPQLEGLADAAVQEKVNAKLRLMGLAGKRLMEIHLRTWKKPEGWDLSSYVSVGFTVEALTPELLSVSQSISDYYAGTAHPNGTLRARTFDLKTGEVVSRRLFSEGALDEVARRVDQKLRADPENKLDGEHLLDTPTAEDIRQVAVAKDGLVFLFDAYTLGSYAEGPAVTKLSFQELDGLLNQELLGPVISRAAGGAATPGVVGSLR